jgi:hypothetical protein
VTLRPPYIYGPENPFYREAFFWDRLLAGRPIIIPEDGQRLMQFVLADDLARAAILAAEKHEAAGKAYNVANPEPVTQVELVDALARAAGKTAAKVFLPREKLLAAGGNLFEPPFYFAQYFDMPPPAIAWSPVTVSRAFANGSIKSAGAWTSAAKPAWACRWNCSCRRRISPSPSPPAAKSEPETHLSLEHTTTPASRNLLWVKTC